MNDLNCVRNEIQNIDKKIAELFEKRMECSKKVAEYKSAHGLSVKDEKREAQLIEANKKNVVNKEIEQYYVRFMKDIMNVSCSYQENLLSGMKVAYCGVEGAFAHIAAGKMFPYARLVPFSSFKDAYMAVENGEFDSAVLPLENSYAGEVGTVMDLTFNGSLKINQVIDLPVEHNLITLKDSSKELVKKVLSHSLALEQCSDYIEKNGFESGSFSNTAAAAKFIKETGDKSLAAIASKETAEIFDLKIVQTNINDSRDNVTKFASFSCCDNQPDSSKNGENQNFILLFTVKNEAGSLAKVLNILGMHGYNMKNLRSRPMKELKWNYYFYIEAQGDINTDNGRDMLKEMSALCDRLKLAGCYFE